MLINEIFKKYNKHFNLPEEDPMLGLEVELDNLK